MGAAVCGLLLSGLASAAQMSTPANFSVGDDGSATYQVPIKIPPGILGMEPNIAVVMNTAEGNGILGIGAALSGLSVITRCGHTTAQDGVVSRIAYQPSDGYCLNGQRLVLVSGTYAANGSRYRTEIDSFSRITLYNSPNQPQWFLAQTKDGRSIEFGHTADSRIESSVTSSQAASAWVENKETDRDGNFLTVTYDDRSAYGDGYAPMRIDYAGTSAHGPTASIVFAYETRLDRVPKYMSGRVVRSPRRLKTISTYAGVQEVRRYTMTYEPSPASQRSRLVGITDCSRMSPYPCMPAISFQWSGVSRTADHLTYAHTSPACADDSDLYGGCNAGNNFRTIRYPDLNGDGVADLCFRSDNGIRCYPGGSANGFDMDHPLVSMPNCANGDDTYDCNDDNNHDTIKYADVNGDGRADLIYRGDNGIRLYLSTGGGVFNTLVQTKMCADGSSLYGACNSKDNNHSIQTPDINGDVRADLCFRSDVGIKCVLSTGNGWDIAHMINVDICYDDQATYGKCNGDDNYSSIDYADFDGDGRADLMFRGDEGIQVFLSNGSGFPTRIASDICAKDSGNYGGCDGDKNYKSIQHPDVNGDGLADLCYRSDTGVHCYMSTGTYWDVVNPIITNACANGSSLYGSCNDANNWDTIKFIDMNDDGLADLVFRSDDGLRIMFSDGSTFGSTSKDYAGLCANSTSCVHEDEHSTMFFGDVNADGQSDFVYRDDEGLRTYLDVTEVPDQLKTITNGMGLSYQLTYAPLTSSIYAKDSGANAATYPKLDMLLPSYVVASAKTSNGISGFNTTSYKYGGLKADMTGRGILGFRWTEATQVDTSVVVHKEFHQDWPYIGMPSTIKTMRPGSGNAGLLREVSYQYSCMDPRTGLSCQIPPPCMLVLPCPTTTPNLHFPYEYQMQEKAWDLNGAVLPVQTATEQFDAYGNLTQSNSWTNDGYETLIVNTYSNNSADWFIGKLTKTTVTRTSP